MLLNHQLRKTSRILNFHTLQLILNIKNRNLINYTKKRNGKERLAFALSNKSENKVIYQTKYWVYCCVLRHCGTKYGLKFVISFCYVNRKCCCRSIILKKKIIRTGLTQKNIFMNLKHYEKNTGSFGSLKFVWKLIRENRKVM